MDSTTWLIIGNALATLFGIYMNWRKDNREDRQVISREQSEFYERVMQDNERLRKERDEVANECARLRDVVRELRK